MGRLPRGDQRAVRPRQEGPPRPRPGQRGPVRPAVRLPHPDQPLRAGRQVPPRRVARDPGADQEVRRGASRRARTKVDVWGTGRASREYLYVDDAAEAIVLAAEPRRRGQPVEPINLGTDREITIRETVETIARLVGFDGELRWDPTKPDGQPRRRVDASRAEQRARLAGPHARSRTACGPRSTGTSPTATKPSARSPAPEPPSGDDAGGDGGRPVGGGQGVDGLVGVEPARVRHDPQLGAAEVRRSAGRAGPAVRRRPSGSAVTPATATTCGRCSATNGDQPRRRRRAARPADSSGRPRRGPGDEVGDADAPGDR